MNTEMVHIPKSLLDQLIVKFDIILANTPIKKDVFINEEQAKAITGYSARKLFDLRQKQLVQWTSNEHGKEIKYSYKSIQKLIA